VTPKVVLFHPAYDGPTFTAPLSLLSLASPLLASGFDVKVIDAAVVPDPEEVIARELQGAVCFGVSILTGPMIRGGIKAAQLVRRLRPKLPIVFGGWHPSLVPQGTLETACIDAIVRGQGELTLLELAQRLVEGKPLNGLRGASFKLEGKAVHNPERPVENINNLPRPAFHLIDFDAYEKLTGVRKLGYATSVGCPYACNYCTDQVYYKRRFNAYTAERVVGDIAELAARYRLDEVALLDSNFPVDIKRAVAIARGLLQAKSRVRWTFQASTDLLCRLSDEEVRLLGESGVSHMGFGTESASPEILTLMNKKHQRIEDMYETARKTELAGIRVTFNLIFGYPGETEAARQETFRVMSDIARKYSNVTFSPNIFTPYPGIPIWPQLKQMGVHEPQSLEEWADLSLGRNVLPWMRGSKLQRLERILQYFLLNNQIRRSTIRAAWLRGGLRRALSVPLRWRLQTNRYGFPWELWISKALERVVLRRSLLTGQALSHPI